MFELLHTFELKPSHISALSLMTGTVCVYLLHKVDEPRWCTLDPGRGAAAITNISGLSHMHYGCPGGQ
jgi:hypothetical protein